MMGRRLTALAAAVVAVALVAGPLWAYPTFGGATGGAALPDGQVQPTGSWMLAGDWQDLDAFATSGGSGDAIHLRAVFGLGDRAEIGIAWSDLDIFGFDGWTGSAKVQLLREGQSGFGLAVGGMFSDFDGDGGGTLENTSLYAVLSKHFAHGNPGHIGAYVGFMRDDLEAAIPGVGSLDDDDTAVFGGLYYLTSDGRFEVRGEWKGSQFDFDSLWGVVLRWYNDQRNTAIQLGWTNAIGPLPFGGDGSGMHVGIAFRTGRGH